MGGGKALKGYDFTLSVAMQDDMEEIIAFLNGYCKKWVFQKEIGESGYLHWQGRVHLISSKTESALINMTGPKNHPAMKGIHWSITSRDTHLNNNFNYVMKMDSRVDGPWKDEDYTEPAVMTRQLTNFLKCDLREWQTQIMQITATEDDRNITCVIDRIGNSGKSIFCEFLEYKRMALELPPMRSMEDIMAVVMGMPTSTCYIIDMPRAMKKEKLSEFYAGIECLKNGYCYDKRYKFRKRRFNRPQIIVFTNVEPKWDYMSLDRWKCFEMANDYSLDERDIETELSALDEEAEEL